MIYLDHDIWNILHVFLFCSAIRMIALNTAIPDRLIPICDGRQDGIANQAIRKEDAKKHHSTCCDYDKNQLEGDILKCY